MDKTQEKKLAQIDKQRDRITALLKKEFSDVEVKVLWKAINSLIEMELEIEQECNQ